MRSNDNILLENAYAKVLNKNILNEEHSNFKIKSIPTRLKEVLDDLDSLPVQNFEQYISRGNLKSGAWYIHSDASGHDIKPFKVLGIKDDGYEIEDEDRSWNNKTIEKTEKGYKILNTPSEDGYRFGIRIYPTDVILGPIDDPKKIEGLEKYVDFLGRRSAAASEYFKQNPNAPMD